MADHISYPVNRREPLVEMLHGVPVSDPYRWLEDEHSSETAEWAAAQNELTSSLLEQAPSREFFKRRLAELWDFEQFGLPFEKGGRWFFTYNPGPHNQSSLYWLDNLDASPRLLLDPNTLSVDGTTALTGAYVDDRGEYLAYSLSESGSDWQEWRVRRIDTDEDLHECVRWSKFSGAAWSADSLGFYYTRYDAPVEGQAYKDTNFNPKVFFHPINCSQQEDTLIYERPDQAEWFLNADVTEDGAFLIFHVGRGTFQENGIFYQKLQDGSRSPVIELLSGFDASYNFLGNDGPRFYFHTNADAPRYRIIAVDSSHAGGVPIEIVAESEDTLETASIVGDRIFCIYLHDASHRVSVFDLLGGSHTALPLPEIGSVEGFHGTRGSQDTFFLFSGFTQPEALFRCRLNDLQVSLYRQPSLKFDPHDFVSEQIFYSSKDGTRIPMFLIHKKGLVRDGKNPAYLYGYGGFNISQLPVFNPARIAWLEAGGLLALPNLRGGGEYGKAWHDAGKLHNKQNVFDDFIAAGEWLVSNSYTSTPYLAIHGRSNGGLLTGACLTQRPDLFGKVVVTVGVLDMLRFHKWTIGWAWVSDYGSPDNPDDFQTLLSYSPYHNVRPGTSYPATLITSGDHDDRVFPAHSFKFAAALQAAQSGQAPILIRIDIRAGHGAGKPTAMLVAEWADIFAFITDGARLL